MRGNMIMIEKIDVKLSGKKGTSHLKGVLVVDSTNTYISRETAKKICDEYEIKTIPLGLIPSQVSVDVASVEIEVKSKKGRINVIILDLPSTYVGTGTLCELGIKLI
jgi:hypothetical protein